MSNPQVDSDGFQVVSSKKSFKKKNTVIPRKDHNFIKLDTKIDIQKSYRCIEAAVEELNASEYLKSVTTALSKAIADNKVVEIVCFGLGHIGECNISRYQLALLLNLKNIFKPEKVVVYDPIFYNNECELLRKFELRVIGENTEGAYIISEKGISIVYLPHCPKQLTNNFLWSNWGSCIQNCILLCNSFTSLIDSHPNRILKETVPFIHKIYPLTTELHLDNIFTYKDIFNDTALHFFDRGNFDSVPSDFWVKSGKPVYENTEEFITKLMIDKLTI